MAELGKVLVLSASAGAGHLRAAQAVERALIGAGAVRDVRHIDVLEYTNKLFRHFYSKAYIEMVNTMPDVLGWLYDYLDKPWKNERRRLAFDKLNTRPFVKLLQQERPDVVICTHFLPAEIISWLKAKERISTRQAIVVTDFDVHAMWLVHHFEHYFVALDETRAHLQQLGIATEKITVSGIPIDPVFAEQKDKRAMRRKHGLKEDRTTILISAGGVGVGPIDHLRDQRIVEDGIDRVVKIRVALEVCDVVDRSRRQVVERVHRVAVVEQRLGEVRADEARSAGDQNSHLFILQVVRWSGRQVVRLASRLPVSALSRGPRPPGPRRRS